MSNLQSVEISLEQPGTVHAVQRRVLTVLLVVQALYAVVIAMTGPVIALLAERMTGSQSQAGLAQAVISVGGVLFSLPLMALSMRRGRRWGIAGGYLAGGVGAVIVVFAALAGSFPGVLVGALWVGASVAAGFQARFAATDLSSAGHAGRAMGTLTWASILSGVIGPSLSGVFDEWGRDLRLPEYTGPFIIVAVGLLLSGVFVFGALRPDPLLLARFLHQEKPPTRGTLRPTIVSLMRNPTARRSIVVLVTVHAAMIALMNMASVHLHHGGATLGVIGLVISVHAAAMYLPGPLVGYLSDRISPTFLLRAGLVLQLVAATTLGAAPEHSSPLIGLGLVLLGLGWAAGFVAGSVLLTTSTQGPIRLLAQGAADFLILLTCAVGAVLAGVIVAAWDYAGLATLTAGAILVVLISVVRSQRGPGLTSQPSGTSAPARRG